MADDLHGSFVRQRRALVATSLVLVVYVVAGVKLTTFNVVGNSFAITRPELIPFGLWLAWLYFLLRYYQLLRDLNDDAPKAALLRRIDHYQIQRAGTLAIALVRNDKANANVKRFLVGNPEIFSRGDKYWHISVYVSGTRPSGTSFSAKVPNNKVPAPSRIHYLRAVYWVALHTRYFTEYYLPFFLAQFPASVWLGMRLREFTLAG